MTAGAALAAAAPAGCGLFDRDPGPDSEPDPLQPVLDEALALAVAYERAALAQPALAARLTPLAGDHKAHAAELARLIGASSAAPGSSAPRSTTFSASTPAEVERTLSDLRESERAAARTATAAARAARPERVGLVGSIAACRATHAEALR